MSIAVAYGHLWETIWNHPENNQLKTIRDNPMVLLPGDRVTIPRVRLKRESRATGARHRFRRRGSPARVRIRFFLDGEPLANEAFLIAFDGGPALDGRLDGDGILDHPAPPDARTAEVWIGSGPDRQHHTLHLGELDPVEDVRGLLGRLMNLGYAVTPDVDDEVVVTEAVKRFQTDHHVEATGDADDGTRRAILDAHGS
jgi:hypothetical protein